MEQKIVCHRGKCYDDGARDYDSVFDSSNIVEQIQRDLNKRMF
ncbi:MAG: hypothetical protein ABH879_07555 [archaeon]